MLTSVELTNFKKHQHFTFEPAEGLTAICGPNWSGKTTLLSAVVYGLFGLRSVNGGSEDLVAAGSKDCWVKIGFRAPGGQELQVIRGPNKAELRLAGQTALLASGQSAVSEEIEQRLGISAKDFLAFHVISQDEAQSLLTLGETKLNEFVTRLTGLNMVEGAIDRLQTLQSEISGALSVLTDREEEIAALQIERSDLGDVISRTAAEVELKKRWRDSLAEELQYRTLTVADVQAKIDAAEKHTRALTVAKGVLQANLDALAAAEAAAKAPSLALVSDKTLTRQRAKVSELRQRVSDLRTQLNERNGLQKSVREAADSLHKAQEAVEALPRPERVFSSQEIVDAQMRYVRAQERAAEAERAVEGSMCLYCMRPFEDADQAALELRLKEARQEEEEATEHAVLVQRSKDQSDRLAQARAVETQWSDYLASLNEKLGGSWPTPEDLEAAAIAAKRAEAELIELEDKHRRYLQATRDVEQRLAQVKKAQEQVANLGEPVKGVPTAKQLQEFREEIRTMEEDYYRAFAGVSELEVKAGALQGSLDVISARLRTAYDEQAKYAEQAKALKACKELSKFLKDNRSRFLQSVWNRLMSYASQFVLKATRGDVTDLMRSEHGKFWFKEGGRDLSVSGSASGMQRAIFSVALKLSLAAALGSSFKVFLFDEITAAAEDEISLLLTSLLAKTGDQILLVTHRQADAAAADSVIELQVS